MYLNNRVNVNGLSKCIIIMYVNRLAKYNQEDFSNKKNTKRDAQMMLSESITLQKVNYISIKLGLKL